MNAPKKRWRRWTIGLALLAGLLVGAYLGREVLLPPVAGFLDVSEHPGPVDAVLVLGGGVEDRPFAAAALYRAGLTRRILLSTVEDSPETEDHLLPPEHEIARRVLLARGVPARHIVLLEGVCVSTVDEAKALARFLDDEPDTSVAVVTHGYHTRRARALFRRALGERASQVRFFAAPCGDFRADDWWRSETGVTTHVLEYLKLVRYRAW
jgi:uncharacterized SAM-binding protein YcdF (DUF218 family)